jgi:hypothetical protein
MDTTIDKTTSISFSYLFDYAKSADLQIQLLEIAEKKDARMEKDNR